MPLQSPLEAGSAFSKFFKGQGNTTISETVQSRKQGVQHYDKRDCGQVEENICHLDEQPLTVLPPLWG